MSLLTTLQSETVTRLSTSAYFSANPSIPVLAESLKDIENQIDIAINQLGIFVLVITPTATVEPEISTIEYREVEIVCRVYENVTLNSTGEPAATVAEAVAFYLQHFIPSGASCAFVVREISLADAGDLLAYDVKITTRGGFTAAPERAS